MPKLIEEALKTAEIHRQRLKRARQDLLKLGNVDNLELTDWETLKLVDTFLFRFIKLQDFLGGKVFKQFLKTIGEYTDPMSFIDMLDRLEKLGIIESSEDWLKLRELRNRLTHEYPEEERIIRRDLKLALKYSHLLEDTLDRIESYLRERKLLP